MKQLLIVLTALALVACSMEAQQIDRDWGKAQKTSWNSMIANPQPQDVASPPTGMEGIHAEGAMNVYNDGFWGIQQETKSEVFSLGVTSNK